MTSKVSYTGDLRTEAIHLKSGISIITDAPVDNNGKGAAFSPTDLMATSLASCMLTIMGIAARNHDINMDNTEAEVLKIMGENPRRIVGIHIKMTMPPQNYSEKEKKILVHAAHHCPVIESIHPAIEVKIDMIWHEL